MAFELVGKDVHSVFLTCPLPLCRLPGARYRLDGGVGGSMRALP